MTFKHVKFEDSPIMRSLERVAQEKGLVKAQPLNKTAAAKKTDLTPTTSLLDNVLKLCAGLRERGFEKQANELEVHLVNYKKAQTLYETSPEKGEDLVHAAHPKGSHKLEGVDAADEGSVVEDILDQYAKSLEMVNKKPTGKLSSAEAIEAVKVTLGAAPLALAQVQSPPKAAPDLRELSTEQLEQLISTNVQEVLDVMDEVDDAVKREITFYSADIVPKIDAIKQAAKNTTLDNLKEIADELLRLSQRLQPGGFGSMWMGGVTENTWAIVEELLRGAQTLANKAVEARRAVLRQRAGAIRSTFEGGGKMPAVTNTNDPVTQAYNDVIKTIGLYKSRIQAKDLPNGPALIDWLDKQALPFAQNNLDAYSKSEYKSDKQVSDSYLSKLNNTLKPRLDAFQQKWSI
jgi:hypothetical protein